MGTGRFVAPKTLEVPLNDGRTRVLAGDRVFLSVGTHAAIPSIPGLEAARPLTGAASRSRSGGSMAGDGRRPETIATIQTTMIHEEGRTARPPRVLRTNADDRLPIASLGRVEGGDGFVEGSHVADVCPQPTIPDPLDDLTQLGAIGYDDEVDSQAARGPRLGWAGNGHQRSSGANHARRPLRDVAAEDIEHQIDPADIF